LGKRRQANQDEKGHFYPMAGDGQRSAVAVNLSKGYDRMLGELINLPEKTIETERG